MHAKTRIIPISIRRTRKSPSPRPSPLLYSRSRTQIAHASTLGYEARFGEGTFSQREIDSTDPTILRDLKRRTGAFFSFHSFLTV